MYSCGSKCSSQPRRSYRVQSNIINIFCRNCCNWSKATHVRFVYFRFEFCGACWSSLARCITIRARLCSAFFFLGSSSTLSFGRSFCVDRFAYREMCMVIILQLVACFASRNECAEHTIDEARVRSAWGRSSCTRQCTAYKSELW